MTGGAIPGQFIPAVEKCIRQVLEAGPLAGFPMQDVRVVVYRTAVATETLTADDVKFLRLNLHVFMQCAHAAEAARET